MKNDIFYTISGNSAISARTPASRAAFPIGCHTFLLSSVREKGVVPTFRENSIQFANNTHPPLSVSHSSLVALEKRGKNLFREHEYGTNTMAMNYELILSTLFPEGPLLSSSTSFRVVVMEFPSVLFRDFSPVERGRGRPCGHSAISSGENTPWS